jgi:signal transduction histidine kinase
METATADPPIRVLLVDDDPDDFVLTRAILNEIPGQQYCLDWVSEYDAALATICRQDHDVYLIDYRLGTRDGLSLLQEALAQGQQGPMILLTGQGELETDRAAMRAGAADYLEKSRLDATLLERAIRYACQQKRSEAELERMVRERTQDLEQEIAMRRKVEADLREADRMKDQFLAVLAHELRNPLVPIRNALGILQISDSPTGQSQAIDLLERQIGIMVRLIDDMLDISRIARGKLRLERESLSLPEILQAALEVSSSLLERAGVTYTTKLSPNLPPVFGDRIRLAQVFANLLNNAAKFTPRGGRVALTVTREDGYLAVRVRDTGVGIAPELLPRVFDMFAQVDRSAERTQTGLGIGLALVRNLVELHGGTVTAYSEGTGKGTEFVVRLPASVGPTLQK